MDFFNYVIVGSGPAGVAAARCLERAGVCMVDAGKLPPVGFAYETRTDALTSGDVHTLLGRHWEMLGNVVKPNSVHAKLRAPATSYVARGEPFPVLNAAGECVVRGAGSYAAGGMSNAWGAQLLRYTDADLEVVGDWPIAAANLDAHYADLEEHIGIAGEMDDMYEFLGRTAGLLPPTPLVPAAMHLLSRYAERSQRGASRLCLGRSRVALLTRPHRGYEPYEFGETDFFSTEQRGIYTARRTLLELQANGHVSYVGGHKLIAYREFPEYVEIDLQPEAGEVRTIRTRHLLLGCGTVHTARMVLLNKQEPGRKLPFVDHPPTLLPLFIPRMFGSALPDVSAPIQLIATLRSERPHEMISFYYPGALLWSDILGDIPLPLSSALRLMPHLLGGMLVAQIWEASRPVTGNCLSVGHDGTVRIDYPHRKPYAGMSQLLPLLRQLGAFSARSLASESPPGWGFHYAGCLPMRSRPGPYETHIDGTLWDSKRIRVIDGSVLPSLPAKNHSLTLMANSARIAQEALRCGY